jgi:hypothetical protein
MHEFAQDLNGVEVIADDFLIAGFGETGEEVDRSLETNEQAFFKKCREWNLKLNKSKLKDHRQKSVSWDTSLPLMASKLIQQKSKRS